MLLSKCDPLKLYISVVAFNYKVPIEYVLFFIFTVANLIFP